MSSIYKLPNDHSHRPLLEWALCVLPLTDVRPYPDIRSRLEELVGEAQIPNLQVVAALLPCVEVLFNPASIVGEIVRNSALAEHDPDFGWNALELGALEQPISALDLPWELREQAKFAVGDYRPVPWANELPPIPGHYAHLSSTKPGLIAYTQTAAKGEADKQTQIRPGRYLTQFYPDLPAETIRRLVNGVARPATLAFARTADEIEQVYLNGPNSCMSRPATSFDSPCHPVRVYGDSDLALAYATPPGGAPTARALVWPEHKHFGRIYGDEVLLVRLLEEEGFVSGSLVGARIRRIPADPDDDVKVVMPYLDDTGSFEIVDEQWLQIDGPFCASRTDGVALLQDRSVCDHCDESCDELYDVGSERWCEGCRDSDAFCSDFSGDEFSHREQCDVIVRRENDHNHVEIWSEGERDDHATFCDGSQENYKSDAFEFVELKNGETWVAWYFAEHGDPDDLASDAPVAQADNDNAASVEREAA